MIVVSFGLGHFIENRRKRLQTPYWEWIQCYRVTNPTESMQMLILDR
jgi:hypothetical protein